MDFNAMGQFCLYPLIGFGVLMIVIMLWRKQYKWGFFFTGVFGSVLVYEGLGYFENGKTISTQYGDWIKSDPFFAWAALICMVGWMVSLVLHLAAYGLRLIFPKK